MLQRISHQVKKVPEEECKDWIGDGRHRQETQQSPDLPLQNERRNQIERGQDLWLDLSNNVDGDLRHDQRERHVRDSVTSESSFQTIQYSHRNNIKRKGANPQRCN